MPSPLMMALATRWIIDGTADGIRRFIRDETQARQAIAAQALGRRTSSKPPRMPSMSGCTCPKVSRGPKSSGAWPVRASGIMPSDAFTVSGEPSEAIRVCLGGQIKQSQLTDAMGLLAYLMSSQT